MPCKGVNIQDFVNAAKAITASGISCRIINGEYKLLRKVKHPVWYSIWNFGKLRSYHYEGKWIYIDL